MLVFTDLSSLVRLCGESVSFHHEILVEMDQIEKVRDRLIAEGYQVTTWRDKAPQIASNLITSKEVTYHHQHHRLAARLCDQRACPTDGGG